jgi:hypothetical protein
MPVQDAALAPFCQACRSPPGDQPGSPMGNGGNMPSPGRKAYGALKSKGRTSPEAAAGDGTQGLGYVTSVCSTCGSGSGSSQRVRLIQVLSPSLAGRAHVWGNKLSVRSMWICVDAPYFEAPGADACMPVCTLGRRGWRGAGGELVMQTKTDLCDRTHLLVGTRD